VIAQGLPAEALNVELYAESEGNGISGYVAASGRSYICPDTERDPRYVQGLDQAKSSLTVPLSLHDRVIGIFNVESHRRAAFTEDDRQFAEIFARYVAIALNILDLMVVERAGVAHTVADNACAEAAGPLNDIASDANALLEMDEFIGREALRGKLRQILDNVKLIQDSLHQVARGPSTIIGAAEVEEDDDDPVLGGARLLVADDDANIRTTIADVFRKFHVDVTVAENGAEAIAHVERDGCAFDLVLSDIHMPDKTGYDVFAAARRHNAAVPVILMTGFGYDPHHSIVRASQEGLQAVLYKPFKVAQLLEEVRKALQSRTPARATQ
jgi:two-component system, sensor histidine kinase SagS